MMINKQELCDWVDELRFVEVFAELDKLPNKPHIDLYNNLKLRYVAGDKTFEFGSQVKVYISLLGILENNTNNNHENPNQGAGGDTYVKSNIVKGDNSGTINNNFF